MGQKAQGPHSQILMMGGGRQRFIFYTQKDHDFKAKYLQLHTTWSFLGVPWSIGNAFHINTSLYYKLLSLLLCKYIETNCLSLCFWLVSFRGKILLKSHPDWYLLGILLKFPNEHPCPFYIGVPLLPGNIFFNLTSSL